MGEICLGRGWSFRYFCVFGEVVGVWCWGDWENEIGFGFGGRFI